MRHFVPAYWLFVFSLYLSSCTTIPVDLIDLPDKKGAVVSDEVQENLREKHSAAHLPNKRKMLATMRITQGDRSEPRVRLAIQSTARGDFKIQVLPVTSLMVIQTLFINREGAIEIQDGQSDSQQSFSLSKRAIRTIFGELIRPAEFYALLYGRFPQSPRFEEWYHHNDFRNYEDARIVFRSERLDAVFHKKLLSAFQLREPFQNKIVLFGTYDSYQEKAGITFPKHMVFEIPKRELRLELHLR